MRRLSILTFLALTACSTPEPEPRATPPPGVAPVTSREASPAELALRAYFLAAPEGRERALAALDAFAVPADPVARARLLRDALPRPARPGASLHEETIGEPPLLAFVGTPADDDASRDYPTALSLIAYCRDPRQSLLAFSSAGVPWDDGYVLAPDLGITAEDEPNFARARARILALLARANRSYGVDPDRTVVAGLSLGGAMAYDVAARHPDRFAGLACVSGGCPPFPTPLDNLRTLKVYIQHGDADGTVPVSVAHENAARLASLGVERFLDVIPGGDHSWPQNPGDASRLRAWLRDQKRDAWPRALRLVWAAGPGRRIYWVELPASPKNRLVEARVADNVVALGDLAGFASVVLHLGEPLVDLEREVVVTWQKTELFRGKLERRFRTLALDLERDGWDTTRAAPARLELTLPRR